MRIILGILRLFDEIIFIFRSKFYSFLLNTRNLRVYGKIALKNPHNITIGDNCAINDNVYINARDKVHIGDNVIISASSMIITAGIDLSNLSIDRQKKHISKPIFITNGTWIGAGAIILSGVSITGSGVVVAAGSVVTKDVCENNVIIAGNPASIIKRI